MNKHFVLIFLPQEGFEDAEYLRVTEAFRGSAIEYMVVSSHFLSAHSNSGHKEVVPDITLERINQKNFSGFVFIGGKSVVEFEGNDIVRGIVEYGLTRGIMLSAIGNAVTILARNKQVKGRRITTNSESRGKIEAAGAYFTGKHVEKDSDLITASGPAAATEFAETIVNTLVNMNSLEGREYLR